MRALVLLLALLPAAFARAQAIDPKELETLLDGIIPAEMQKQRIPGAAFLLVQNGKVVLAKSYGFADVERKRPISIEKTILPIGSITKVFTFLALVQLADRGALDLDADVNRSLKTIRVPDGPRSPRSISSRTRPAWTSCADACCSRQPSAFSRSMSSSRSGSCACTSRAS